MINSTPMTDNLGFEYLSTNLFKTAIEAWRNAGGVDAQNFGQIFTLGLIPIALAATLLIRTRNPLVSILSLALSTAVLRLFNLVPSYYSVGIYLFSGIGLAVFFMNWYKR